MQKQFIYSPELDMSGGYDRMIQRFEELARRTPTFAFAVDTTTASAIETAINLGKTAPAVKIHHVTVDGRDFHVVTQTTEALYTRMVLKNECLPVSAGLTTGRNPATTMIALATTRQFPKLLGWMETRRLEAKLELDRLLAAVNATYDHEKKAAFFQGSDEPITALRSGATLSLAGKANAAKRAEDPSGLMRPIAFVHDHGCTPKQTAFVVVTPAVLRIFGGGNENGGLTHLVRLAFAAFASGEVKEIKSAVLKLRAFLTKLATSPKVHQRYDRCVPSVQMKTRAGAIERGWVAVGYDSNVLKKLCRNAGVKWEDRHRMAGRIVSGLRFPQNGQMFLFLCMPDAPQDVWDTWKPGKQYPVGQTRVLAPLEEDTLTMNPEDVAADFGDKDGDGRNYYVLPARLGITKEALRWIRRRQYQFRKEIIAAAWGTSPEADPVVKAWEHDPAKLVRAMYEMKPVRDLDAMDLESGLNQTRDIGDAYNMAFHAMVLAETSPGSDLAAFAQALMVSIYEEQLAGLSLPHRRLFGTMRREEEYTHDLNDENGEFSWPLWRSRLKQLASACGYTQELASKIVNLHDNMRAGKIALGLGKGKTDVPVVSQVKSALALVYRAVSKGTFGRDGRPAKVVAAAANPNCIVASGDETKTMLAWFEDLTARGSYAAGITVDYLTNVYPKVAHLGVSSDDDVDDDDDVMFD